MTSKERVYAALEGRPVDRMPVTVLYNQLYQMDHFGGLTGRPQSDVHRWLYAPPDEHLAVFRGIVEKVPFEILQPQIAPSRRERENTEFVERDGVLYRRDRATGACHSLATVSGHPLDYRANETQFVRDRADVDAVFRLRRADDLLSAGINDYVDAAVAEFGRDHFILPGGVVGTLYSCHSYVGLTNLYRLLIEDPDLIHYLSARILEQNIECIRQLAAAGADAILIDDATATSDMISVQHYEEFSLPYVREMVREIHALGHRALVVYFGGVMDRLDQIASLGADGLSVETSMKGYVNDIEEIARRIGDRVTLFGNIDPVGILERGTDDELEAEIVRQADAGRRARGFILSTGSPITPATPLSRVRRFLELCWKHGVAPECRG